MGTHVSATSSPDSASSGCRTALDGVQSGLHLLIQIKARPGRWADIGLTVQLRGTSRLSSRAFPSRAGGVRSDWLPGRAEMKHALIQINAATTYTCAERGCRTLMGLVVWVTQPGGCTEVAMNTITSPRTETIVRDQFRSLKAVSETIGFNADRQRRALRMTVERWAEWSEFLLDGPLPAWPKLPNMLRMLGVTTYRFAVLAEHQGPAFP